MPSDDIFLGSDVVIMSIENARMLVKLLEPSKARTEELQRLGILDILMDLSHAVKRHGSEADDDD